MRIRKAYFSQFHSVNSKTVDSDCRANTELPPHQQIKAKETLIKYDEQNCISYRSGDPGAIQGWTESMKQNYKSTALKKQIRPHARTKKRINLSQYEPKCLQQTNTKGTISYLKEMLAYLRTSSENPQNARSLSSKNKCSLPSITIEDERTSSSTVLVKGQKKRKKVKREEQLRQEEIIQQLINGINKLPVLGPSNSNISVKGKRKGREKFTLNKLLD